MLYSFTWLCYVGEKTSRVTKQIYFLSTTQKACTNSFLNTRVQNGLMLSTSQICTSFPLANAIPSSERTNEATYPGAPIFSMHLPLLQTRTVPSVDPLTIRPLGCCTTDNTRSVCPFNTDMRL